MPLDPQDPISPLESDTIRAALKAIAINVVTLATIFTGKTFNIDAVQHAIDLGVPLAVNFISIYYAARAIQGRVNATQTIKKG